MMDMPDPDRTTAVSSFDYDTAFSRNLGLLQPEEQHAFRTKTVAIAGMGAVGGSHLLTLARMGIGKFRIADFDRYELANVNRQPGALMSSLGQPKVTVMQRLALDINPDIEIETFGDGIGQSNIDDFLDKVDLAIDGLDYFAVDARDVFYQATWDRGIPVIAAGPLGCSVALLVFRRGGMSWQQYFAMDLAETDVDKYILFAIGTAPKGLQFDYIDRRYIDLEHRKGPSLAPAVSLCAGATGVEALKLLTGRGKVYAAPYYQQYDAYKCRFVRGRLSRGNRNLLQRIKFRAAKKMLAACQP